MNQAQRLRRELEKSTILVAPGAYDAGTALLVQGAGFPVVYMTGAGVSATYGLPDYGLIGMAEMVAHARGMAGALTIPLIADADTGYGNERRSIVESTFGEQTRIRCVQIRGGTSKGLYFHEEDLPHAGPKRDRVLQRLIGAPDVLEIDGLGGSRPITSKVAIISRSQRDAADVEYTFAQVEVKKTRNLQRKLWKHFLRGWSLRSA